LIAAIRRRFAYVPPIPTVCEHRDFSPWNVFMRRDGSLSVFDWESSVLRGVPALDVIYFLSYLAAFGNRMPFSRDSYRAAWDPSTATGRVNLECLTTYARAVGVDSSAFTSLRLLTWVVHARSEYLRYAADSGGPPAADALRHGLFLSLIEEEAHRDPGR
jgi:Ser/Thr protein kinase RdoA (MazF antagonist)